MANRVENGQIVVVERGLRYCREDVDGPGRRTPSSAHTKESGSESLKAASVRPPIRPSVCPMGKVLSPLFNFRLSSAFNGFVPLPLCHSFCSLFVKRFLFHSLVRSSRALFACLHRHCPSAMVLESGLVDLPANHGSRSHITLTCQLHNAGRSVLTHTWRTRRVLEA